MAGAVCASRSCGSTTDNPRPRFLVTNENMAALIDKVCRLAIVTFSVYVAPLSFSAAFFGAALWGACDDRFRPVQADSVLSRACSQGLIHTIAGYEIPEEAGIFADHLVRGVHVWCHAPIFVPLVGFAAGIYAGREAIGHYRQGLASLT